MTIQSILLIVLLVWMVYRFVLVIGETQTWKECYAKMKENRDPVYLKEQQRKRDLEFDFGSLDNRSQGELT